jgi:hypothetical protein
VESVEIRVTEMGFIFGVSPGQAVDFHYFEFNRVDDKVATNELISATDTFLTRTQKGYKRVIGFGIGKDIKKSGEPAAVVDLTSEPKPITLRELKIAYGAPFLPIFLAPDNIFIFSRSPINVLPPIPP